MPADEKGDEKGDAAAAPPACASPSERRERRRARRRTLDAGAPASADQSAAPRLLGPRLHIDVGPPPPSDVTEIEPRGDVAAHDAAATGGPALEPTRGPAAGLDQPKASRWARPSVFTGLELSSRAEVLREWFDYTA